MAHLRLRIALFLTLVTLATTSNVASAQFNSLRGHYHRRDGLFHTERVRWGGGLTVQGAGVLTHLIDVAGPIAASFAGRDLQEDNSQTQRRALTLGSDYAVEQRRANDLLERTARLVGYEDAPALAPSSDEPTPSDVGPDPWKPRPSAGGAGPEGEGDAPSSAGDPAKSPWKKRP